MFAERMEWSTHPRQWFLPHTKQSQGPACACASHHTRKDRLFASLLFRVWSVDQQQQHHLTDCKECRTRGPSPNLLNEKKPSNKLPRWFVCMLKSETHAKQAVQRHDKLKEPIYVTNVSSAPDKVFKRNNKEWGRMDDVSIFHVMQQKDSGNMQQPHDLGGARQSQPRADNFLTVLTAVSVIGPKAPMCIPSKRC